MKYKESEAMRKHRLSLVKTTNTKVVPSKKNYTRQSTKKVIQSGDFHFFLLRLKQDVVVIYVSKQSLFGVHYEASRIIQGSHCQCLYRC